jgi:hypothetical protein
VRGRSAGPILLFASTAGLGAALLFVVQPLITKLLLPSYGGTPMVWATSSLCFQVLLLLAYVYSHVATARLGPRRQPWVHLAVLAVPLVALPIALPTDAAPPVGSNPVLWFVRAVLLVVGLPFAVVATTGPLLQRWYSWMDHHRSDDPYFLFAASNLGSFGGLLAYPFLIEPHLTLDQQRAAWSAGFGVFLVLTATCGVVTARRVRATEDPGRAPTTVDAGVDGLEHGVGPHPRLRATGIGRRRLVTWFLLAMLPSSLMLSVTTHLSTDVAAIPLLWVVPLAIYLATFVVAFLRSTRRVSQTEVTLACIAALVTATVAVRADQADIPLAIGLDLVLLALAGYAAHSRLAADRPPAEQLTSFYLVVSAGGAAGGVVNGLLAPNLLDRILEYPVGIAAVPLLMVGLRPEARGDRPARRSPLFGTVPGVAIAVTIALTFTGVAVRGDRDTIYRDRTFFGSYEVDVSEDGRLHTLVHGTTTHGSQWNDGRRTRPTTYYSDTGPLGDVFGPLDGRFERVGAIGLGAGSLAAYGRPGQSFTFFEIDPAVVSIAENPRLFTYLRDSEADVRTITGDGRLEIARQPDASFDLLVLDAFSSDSIPIHLLTREAFDLYARKLAPGGVLAVHISNRLLDLEPVVAADTGRLGWPAALGVGGANRDGGRTSVWVVASPDPDRIRVLLDHAAMWRPVDRSRQVVWTDDYSSILPLFR